LLSDSGRFSAGVTHERIESRTLLNVPTNRSAVDLPSELALVRFEHESQPISARAFRFAKEGADTAIVALIALRVAEPRSHWD
jgi:hypothetical protein